MSNALTKKAEAVVGTSANLVAAEEVNGTLRVPLLQEEAHSRGFEQTRVEQNLAALTKQGWTVNRGPLNIRTGEFGYFEATPPPETVNTADLSVEDRLRVDGNAAKKRGDLLSELQPTGFPVVIDTRRLSGHHVSQAYTLVNNLLRHGYRVDKVSFAGTSDWKATIFEPQQGREVSVAVVQTFTS